MKKEETLMLFFVFFITLLLLGVASLFIGAIIYLVYDILIDFPETFGWPFISYWKCVGIGIGIVIIKKLFTSKVEVEVK